MSNDEYEEFIKILQYTAPRMTEYFNIAKSVWTLVYDSIEAKYRKNKKEILSNKGFFFHLDKRDNKYYVWEYGVSPAAKKSPESKTSVKLIYCDDKNKLTIPKIITTFSDTENRTKLPVLEMISKGDFPIEETLLPLFKRKTIARRKTKKIPLSFVILENMSIISARVIISGIINVFRQNIKYLFTCFVIA